MKILAVIPACEGSKVFPNKNIRIVNGKPLIYYVINNAKNSKYIDDVIVTTNSSEIIGIAKQMGVMTKLRDDRLCNPNTSLDMVVNDVFNDINIRDYDYIVTMQSIAPTLKTSTLDKAIEECVTNNYDTVISVVAKQKFCWNILKNKPVPLYSKRVNRSLLEPVYAETGGFLITKSFFISNKSRLGKCIKLFELPENEAVDVYCFGDLKQVENILNNKTVAIYVNGNNQIGLGHIYRVIQLADELFVKPDIYFDYNQTETAAFGKTTHNLIGVNGTDGLFKNLQGKDYNIFINDILSTDKIYMQKLKNILPCAKIVNFEDEGSGAVLADKVFNALYEDEYLPNVSAGEKYFIASKLFLLYEPIKIKDKVENVLISFGGADPQNYTDNLLEIITEQKYKDVNFIVVAGKVKQNVEELLKYNSFPNIQVLYNIDNMPEIMSKCDIAFTSRGRTGFELAFLGIPCVSIAQNAREELHTFLSQKNGINYLGRNPSSAEIKKALEEYIFSTKEFRQSLQDKMLAKDLKNGRKNVMNIILNL